MSIFPRLKDSDFSAVVANWKTTNPFKVRYLSFHLEEFSDLLTIATAAGFAAVHVTVVNKSARLAAGVDRDDGHDKSMNKCLCAIM